MEKMRVSILPNMFLREDGTYDLDKALNLSGKIAGVCYDKEGFSHIDQEPVEKTLNRINDTLDNGHHSVYDHIMINFDFQNIPKILAMVLNNEHEYTTSEKSARYTKVVRGEDSIISPLEEELYNKWLDIFTKRIEDRYGDVLDKRKIRTLARENARYLITVFMPTQMIYSTTLRQINYIASWMKEYIANVKTDDYFSNKLASYMKEFLNELKRMNVLEDRLMDNRKSRKISLFGDDLSSKEDYFGDIYTTTYKSSFAYLAQAQRHRTLDYQMERMDDKEYFVPPILEDDDNLVKEWLHDMALVSGYVPQGELVLINESGKYDDFILKCKERLCSEAQLEIANRTRDILLLYKKALEDKNSPLAKDILKHSRGARCTFPDFKCVRDCGFAEGKRLIRKI